MSRFGAQQREIGIGDPEKAYFLIMVPANPSQPGRSTGRNPYAPGSNTRRIVYTLALFPIIATVSLASCEPIANLLRLKWFDEFHCLNTLLATLWVGGMLTIWRGAVAWTPRRVFLSAMACMIPFVQVIYGRSWWLPPSAGWLGISSVLMRIGQGQIGIGLWLWLLTWIWWGWEGNAMQSADDGNKTGSVKVGSMGRRIVVCLAMMPMQIGCYILLYETLEGFLGAKNEVPVSMSIIAVVSIAAWIMIWRRAVSWTRKTTWQTIWLTLALVALPVATQFIYTSRSAQGAVVALTIIGWCAWMMATIRLWPMVVSNDAQNATTPRCLQCGYLLTGLTSTRCPECGHEPTLDVLWQSTTGEL